MITPEILALASLGGRMLAAKGQGQGFAQGFGGALTGGIGDYLTLQNAAMQNTMQQKKLDELERQEAHRAKMADIYGKHFLGDITAPEGPTVAPAPGDMPMPGAMRDLPVPGDMPMPGMGQITPPTGYTGAYMKDIGALMMSEGIATPSTLSMMQGPKPVKPDLFQAVSKEDPSQRMIVKRTDTGFTTMGGTPVGEDKFTIAKVPTQEISGSPGQMGLTTAAKTQLQKEATKAETTTDVLKETIAAVKKTPVAVGGFGAFREDISALGGMLKDLQTPIISPIGGGIQRFFDEGGEITNTRTLLGMVQGRLIPSITGDTSGRYSDKDMERVQQVSKTLKTVTSSDQVVDALETILEIHEKDMDKQRKYLGWGTDKNLQKDPSGAYIINTQEEYNALPSGFRFFDPADGKYYRKP